MYNLNIIYIYIYIYTSFIHFTFLPHDITNMFLTISYRKLWKCTYLHKRKIIVSVTLKENEFEMQVIRKKGNAI